MDPSAPSWLIRLIYLLLGILALMVFAIVYIVGQMRELKKKLDAKVELDAINIRYVNEARERDQGRGFEIPPAPTRTVPPAPDADELAEAILRMRKTDKNFNKTKPPARFERPQPEEPGKRWSDPN